MLVLKTLAFEAFLILMDIYYLFRCTLNYLEYLEHLLKTHDDFLYLSLMLTEVGQEPQFLLLLFSTDGPASTIYKCDWRFISKENVLKKGDESFFVELQFQ